MTSTTTTKQDKSDSNEDRLVKEEYIYELDFTRDEDKEEGFSKTQILIDLLKQLRSGGDLYRISLPSALLAPVSMLEYIANYSAPFDYVLNIHKLMDPEQRFMTILRWWMSNLCSTPKKGILHAKPYNAILGEVFVCKFIHDNSKTLLLAEQVSHHPPITSIYTTNRKNNLSLTATLKPKSKFHGNSASTLLDGEVVIHIHSHDEKYVIDFPWVLAKGLILGSQCIEIYEFLKISCEKTGYNASIEFKSGTNNSCEGHVCKGSNTLYKISGSITEKVSLKSTNTKKSMTFVDASKVPKVFKYVKPVAKQMSNESRRVWHNVTHAIQNADYLLANNEKHEVEQEQRKLRTLRQENGEKWEPKHFAHVGNDRYKCKYFIDGKYKDGEKDIEEIDLFKVDQDELDFIKKHVPNYFKNTGTKDSLNGSQNGTN